MRLFRQIIYIIPLLLIAAALRLYNLNGLPGEWYGDISIVHRYVVQVTALHWPFYYSLSSGPLYHYLIAPIIALGGYNYISYKIASVVVSGLAIVATMLLAREVGGYRLSLATGFVASVSSWFLIFSRLGNSQIAIPLLTALMGYLILLYTRTRRMRFLFLGTLVSALGMYSYPQTFILPVVFLIVIAAYAFERWRRELLRLLASFIATAILAIPFAVMVIRQPDNFRTGYVGDKFFGTGQFDALGFSLDLAKNLMTTLMMLQARGDSIFRSNVPSWPQLDQVSGLLLILGFMGLLRPDRRRYLPLMLISVVLLVVPASWPFVPSGEIPSASRTIGITPFIYLLVADGLLWLYQLIRGEKDGNVNATRKGAANWAVSIGVALILILNVNRYFLAYAWNLPNHNVAYGSVIASEMDKLPTDAEVYVGGCCWGAWGQPEPDGIIQQLTPSRNITVLSLTPLAIESVRPNRSPKYFFWDPRDEKTGFAKLLAAFPGGKVEKKMSDYGDPIYIEYSWPSD